MGGPVIPWRAGRVDVAEKEQKVIPDGRLPNANAGCPHATNAHIRDIFGRMGFNDREMVALIGAHVVGRCHPEASGFWGPWTNAETTFSNQYFVLLLNEKWVAKTTHEGKPWKGPFQFESAKDPQIMMLPADLWLLEDPKFRKIVEEYAADEKAFYRDFAAAFSKLMELGVPFPSSWWGF
jgi:cytochrome c peroxidase